MQKNEWFRDWFNSPYYHILYKNRDLKEANLFISNLAELLSLNYNSTVLDLGCGKGRHSVELKKYYNTVKGIDLSSNSIKNAKKHEAKGLTFAIEDMRDFNSISKFNAIFNLFTSFGYFNDLNDNINTLISCNRSLFKNGIIVIDYLNANKIKMNIHENETKVIDGIEFHIERKIENEKILKKIVFEHDNISYNFEEKVQLFTLSNFIDLFKKSGFILEKTFGNYHLEAYETEISDRLILIAKKK